MNVAVAVFASNSSVKPLEKTAQARLESILGDNGLRVLDEAKVGELKDVWKRLEDPTYVLTAKELVANAKKYDIQLLVRAFLRCDVVRGLAEYFSATAHIDVRFIDKEARVISESSSPMGVPGCPPSDGLTDSSASVNAVQRAVDEVAEKLKFAVLAPASVGSIPLRISGSSLLADIPRPAGPENDKSLHVCATLKNPNWATYESITCTARAPGGPIAAVAGYVKDVYANAQAAAAASGGLERPSAMDRIRGGGPTLGGNMTACYGSRVHLVDAEKKTEINVFECEEIGRGGKEERKVVACTFASNWRHLAAVTGRKLLLWDTQVGRLLDSRNIADLGAPSSLGFVSKQEGSFLVVAIGGKTYGFKIEMGK
jgi:hypothetical protein